jgi:hypothetical protein
MKTKLLGAIVSLAILGFSSVGAANANTFDWSFSAYSGNECPCVSGSGTLIATDEPGGMYEVTSMTGTVNGAAIELAPVGTVAGQYGSNDNVIFYPEAPWDSFVDEGGLAWEVVGGTQIGDLIGFQLHNPTGASDACCYLDYYAGPSGNNALESLSFSPVTATPLPAALPLFATGLGGLGLFGGRRKRKNAATLAAA